MVRMGMSKTVKFMDVVGIKSQFQVFQYRVLVSIETN